MDVDYNLKWAMQQRGNDILEALIKTAKSVAENRTNVKSKYLISKVST